MQQLSAPDLTRRTPVLESCFMHDNCERICYIDFLQYAEVGEMSSLEGSMSLIKTVKEIQGLSGNAMAKRLGITHQRYYYMEENATTIRWDHLVKLKQISELGWEEFGTMIELEGKRLLAKERRKGGHLNLRKKKQWKRSGYS